jgi:hypothetical protein
MFSTSILSIKNDRDCIPLNGCTALYYIYTSHLSVDLHCNCFHFFGIVNSVAVNIGVQPSWNSDFICFWYIPSSGISGSNGISVFNLFFFFIIHLFTCIYIFWSFLPLFPHDSTLSTPLASRQNLFCAFLPFHCRVEISNNKKDIAFLLVEIRTAIQTDS